MHASIRGLADLRIETTPRKIALFGYFGEGNLGNECTLQALLYNIRKYLPDARISCICPGPEETRSAYKISASAIREMPPSPINNHFLRIARRVFVGIPMELIRWLKAIATLRDVDMLIMTGTGMLGDFGIGPGLHYEILKWVLSAKLCRCKVIFLSVGVGPIRRALSRRLVKGALSCADYRSYRDRFSRDYLKHIGFDETNDKVYPDLAFSFPTDQLPQSVGKRRNNAIIGIGLMTYFNRRNIRDNDETAYHNYIAGIGTFVRWLLEKKYTVRLLIGDVSYDHRAVRDLKEFIEKDGITYEDAGIIDEPAASVMDVLSQLNATDLVVASRFHNVLLALMLGKPVLAISYHEKVDALMADVGLDGFRQDIESIDLETMIRQFETLEERSPHLNQQLNSKAESCRIALDDQYTYIFSTYLK
ncbi:MAG TPA: polysaccharide pyruvyl transferase family protein [Candidatus Acidoferrum sp.]|nr:polysaccharide pyruvyl transferase family protein [Candidatus Acidoferrum sp.]